MLYQPAEITTMPKFAPPVRLQDDLMVSARFTGAQCHRSATEQIEYWAVLGRQISTLIDPARLLDVASGVARLRVEPVSAQPIEPNEVFSAVDADSAAGVLADRVTAASVRYQAVPGRSDMVERIDSTGRRTCGRFTDGVFESYVEDYTGG